MSENEYLLAWSIYVVASLMVVVFWCWVTSPIKWLTLRLALRLPALVILLMPVKHAANEALQVPAIASIAFNFIAKDYTAVTTNLMVVIGAILGAIVIALLLGFVGHLAGVFFQRFSNE